MSACMFVCTVLTDIRTYRIRCNLCVGTVPIFVCVSCVYCHDV